MDTEETWRVNAFFQNNVQNLNQLVVTHAKSSVNVMLDVKQLAMVQLNVVLRFAKVVVSVNLVMYETSRMESASNHLNVNQIKIYYQIH
jgi:hypothetical protein